MKIAHISATFPPYYGGAGTVCYHNALELARRGHTVTVFTAAHPPGKYPYPAELTVRRLPVWFRIGNAPLLPGLLKLKDFDILHLHYPFVFGAEMVATVSKLRHIPVVLTIHNELIGDGLRHFLFNTYSFLTTRYIFSGVRKFAAVSLDHARSCRFAPLLRQRWDDVVEIPNGVDTVAFCPDANGREIRRQFSLPKEAKIILFVGSLDRAHHYRRVDLLLEAMRLTRDTPSHLVVAGGGDWLAKYQGLAHEFHLDAFIHFLGPVHHFDLPGVYAAADIVVLPSQMQESFGLVLIEAMSSGKPVIASDLPGVRTVVNDGQDGLLVTPGDAVDLANTIKLLLNDPKQRHQMGKSGRAKVEAKYTWTKIVDRLESIYTTMLDERISY